MPKNVRIKRRKRTIAAKVVTETPGLAARRKQWRVILERTKQARAEIAAVIHGR